MASLLKLSKIYDNQLWLSISKNIKQEAWIQSQSQQSNAVAKTNAYYNHIALHTLLPEIEAWFENDYPDGEFPITIFKDSCLPTVWEFLNGTVIEIKGNRIVLITETTETDELCICQEWIDIPSWQGDYFVAVQVNPEDDWVRLRGFIEYSLLQRLKDNKGIYDKQERAYYIPNKYLTDSENIGDLVDNLQPITREELAPIPTPELTSELLQDLGDRAPHATFSDQPKAAAFSDRYIYYPRLAISFQQWATLLVDDKTRESLYHKRYLQRIKDSLKNSGFQSLNDASNQNINVPKLPAYMGENNNIIRNCKVFKLGQIEIVLTIIIEPSSIDLTKVGFIVENAQKNQSLPSDLELILEDQNEAISRKIKKQKNKAQFKTKINISKGTEFSLTIILHDSNFQEIFCF